MERPVPSQVLNNRWPTELKPHSPAFLLLSVTLSGISLVCLCCLPGYAPSQTLVHPPAYLWEPGEDVVWETERSWMLCRCCSGVTKTFQKYWLGHNFKTASYCFKTAYCCYEENNPIPARTVTKTVCQCSHHLSRARFHKIIYPQLAGCIVSFHLLTAMPFFGFNQLCSVFFFWFDRKLWLFWAADRWWVYLFWSLQITFDYCFWFFKQLWAKFAMSLHKRPLGKTPCLVFCCDSE